MSLLRYLQCRYCVQYHIRCAEIFPGQLVEQEWQSKHETCLSAPRDEMTGVSLPLGAHDRHGAVPRGENPLSSRALCLRYASVLGENPRLEVTFSDKSTKGQKVSRTRFTQRSFPTTETVRCRTSACLESATPTEHDVSALRQPVPPPPTHTHAHMHTPLLCNAPPSTQISRQLHST